MGKPAAKIMDLTSNAGTVTGPGATTVLINGLPAARVGDMHQTPMVMPGTPPLPLVGGPIVGPGCINVLIEKLPASVAGDMVVTAGPPASIMLGSPNVLIGMNSVVNKNAGNESNTIENTASALRTDRVSLVNGAETSPIEIQAFTSTGQKSDSSENHTLTGQNAVNNEEKESKNPTIADFVDVLKTLESEKSYEEARFFASELDFLRLCEMTRSFVEGEDPNPKNDPDLMPTRFMILYGADDSKLREINKHPDNFENQPRHLINVGNLRKALRIIGNDISERGNYNNDVFQVHLAYIHRITKEIGEPDITHFVKNSESLGYIARLYGLAGWKHLYNINKEKIGENPDLLKPGTELEIPRFDPTAGNEKLKAKGIDISEYTGGLKYRYPWVPLSFSMGTRNGELFLEKDVSGKQTVSLIKKRQYQIINRITGEMIANGTLSRSDELEILIPHVSSVQIRLKTNE